MIIFKASFKFARRVKQSKTSLINDQKKTNYIGTISEEQIEFKKEDIKEEITQQNLENVQKKVFEKKFIKSPEFMMAYSHLPEEILKKARKVFSKYPLDELREASFTYMRMYQLLHALEKPLSITIKRNNLFENPENLQKLTEKKKLFIYIKKEQMNRSYQIRYLKEEKRKIQVQIQQIVLNKNQKSFIILHQQQIMIKY